MLTDVNFNAPYVYTGLISPNQKETNAYWVPRNVSVSSLPLLASFEDESITVAFSSFSTTVRWNTFDSPRREVLIESRITCLAHVMNRTISSMTSILTRI